jgi:hypothetical protein
MRDCNATVSTTCDAVPATLCVGLATTRVGEPDAGNLHVRFDEGEQLTAAPYSTVSAEGATVKTSCRRIVVPSFKREAQP